MKFTVKQKDNEYYTSAFDILNEGKKIGEINVFLNEKTKKPEAKIEFNNETIKLIAEKINEETKEKEKKCNIIKDDIAIGNIKTDEFRKGIKEPFYCNKSIINEIKFNTVPIESKLKTINTISNKGKQIIQIERSNIIYDNLYNFECYVSNDEYAVIALIHVIYSYMTRFFVPGVKIIKSTVKKCHTVFERDLLQKDNKGWIAACI